MHVKFFAGALLTTFSFATVALTAQERPKITGISHLAVYTSDAAATDHYYRAVLGAEKGSDPENPQGVRYILSATSSSRYCPCRLVRGSTVWITRH